MGRFGPKEAISGGVRCPACEATGSFVVDSRAKRNGEYIRRRRQCLKCNFRYTTYEFYGQRIDSENFKVYAEKLVSDLNDLIAKISDHFNNFQKDD